MDVKLGYKRTKVGVIPEEWGVKQLGELGSVVRGGSPRPAGDPRYFNGNFVPWLTVASLTNSSEHELTVSETASCLTEAGSKHSRILSDGTLIIANSGATLGIAKLLGLACCANDGIAAIIDQQLGDKPFVCFYVNTQTKRLREVVATGNGQPNLNTKLIREIAIPFPPAAEQRAIAAALSDADALLGGLDRLIAKKRDLKQAAMQQLLNGQTRLPGFHGAWEVKRLGHAGLCLRGVSYQGESDLSTHDTDQTKRLLRSNNVQDAAVVTAEVQFVNAARVSTSQVLQKNDILICMANGSKSLVGKAGLFAVDDGYDYTFGAFMGCFRTDVASANPAFLYSLLLTGRCRDYINNLLAGSSINNLRPSSIESLQFPFPSVSEQTAIAAVLSDMDAELAAIEAQRDKTRALKQAMMQELLTGKTRLVTTPSHVVSVDFVDRKPAAQQPASKSHNWQINEAVVVAVLVKQFGSEQYPLGRKRCTKLAYLMHRHVEHVAQGYLKKAAGPYNPAVKYKGPEGIAQKNGYIRAHANAKFSGFVAAGKVAQAEGYFNQWYGRDVLAWLEQFRFQSNDELELLTTVDMAIEDLKGMSARVDVEAVKAVIRNHPEWEAKLERNIFSDADITRAVYRVGELFPNS